MRIIALTALALLPVLPLVAHADEAPAVASPDPLPDYRPYRDEPVASWREANDTVGRIGGWKTYAKERMEPAEAPQAPKDSPQ